jgi:hypothetical protein
MADESRVLEIVRRYYEHVGADIDHAQEIYHDDAVLEFPSQENGSKALRRSRSGGGNILPIQAKCATGSGESPCAPSWPFVELTVSYDGESWMQGLQLLEFRGDRVARERIYVTETWQAPEWRAPRRAATPADRPEETTPV